ncbi:PorP/SprF family type IX secretion system membrane protein [Lentiprolixibacter aurantiacus]|uniref:PorP/SprF family type IX secretion system membrane protein n=1 Tax=Lentiprolixibacter aurantiacus TaxID=2993939 RepID=A0AAE3SNP5_9FLAO|nr:PorP/SprF family type IX secretion system membrane protein [Lentiprolixibacter aurantiacus]MCX2719401.1 PorP/SprF family type IX secretion system membrane protein [Lentiprolixibacter aurantiacus]
MLRVRNLGFCHRYIILLGIWIAGFAANAQDTELPVDFRQHNLTEYNSSLFSPVFSLDRNQPQSLAFWSRWQWQLVDEDPTTFLLNYSRRVNNAMAGGIGVFQHNTGLFLNRGGVLNYAFTTQLAPEFSFAAGLNVFGYQRELADDSFLNDPNLPDAEELDAFILQVAPGVRFQYGPVSLGMTMENLLQFNFNAGNNEAGDAGNIYLGFLGYQMPIRMFEQFGESYLQHTIYFKSLPGFDNQVGITSLLTTPKFWAQLGFNNFYGASGGLGIRISNKFSLGALIEYGTQDDLQDRDPTFELVTAFNFGPRGKPEEDEIRELEKDEPILETEIEQQEQEDEKQRLEEEASMAKLEKEKELKKEQDSITAAQKIQEERQAQEYRQRKLDSIAEAKKLDEQKAKTQRLQDSVRRANAARKQTPVAPRKGEKYEEVVNEIGIAPGYYLIANVFGTKRYFDAFMKTLNQRGLSPKSFYRESKKYNYVYLAKFNTMEEARQARDSQLNGTYKGDLWIFRMVRE